MDFSVFIVMRVNKIDTYIIDDFVEGIGKVLKKHILFVDMHAKNSVEKF